MFALLKSLAQNTVGWFIVRKNIAEWLTDSANNLKRTS
jgi:hypothetical protein